MNRQLRESAYAGDEDDTDAQRAYHLDDLDPAEPPVVNLRGNEALRRMAQSRKHWALDVDVRHRSL